MGETKKPKTMQNGSPGEFQTDPFVLDYLAPYLPKHWVVWESAAGEGNLTLGFLRHGHDVVASDIAGTFNGVRRDFFEWEPDLWDVQATNPPYGPGDMKDRWLERSYALGKPFALLLPLTTLEGRRRQALFRQYGVQLIVLPKRPTFTTPNGTVGGGWFPCAWYCSGLNLPDDLIFAEVL